MSDPIPNPMGGPGAQAPTKGGGFPQAPNTPRQYAGDHPSQAPNGDTGATAGKVETEEEIRAKIAAGKFELKPEELAKIYDKYRTAFDALMTAQQEALNGNGRVDQNPGMAIKGIAKIEQQCHKEARVLSYRLTSVGNDLGKLLSGLAETAKSSYGTDSQAADATKAAGPGG